MKIKTWLLVLGIISVLASGCGAKKSAQMLTISCDDFYQENFISRELAVERGEEVKINLCSNPSTGFLWIEEPGNSDPAVLVLDSHDFLIKAEKGTDLPPGTPGTQQWIFTAGDSGRTQLFFEYSRNWEGGEKGIWTFTLDVAVK